MKKLITKTSQIILALLVGFAVTACPGDKKDANDGGGTAIPPYGVPGCPGCPPGTGQNLALAFGKHSNTTIALGLNLTATGGTTSVQPGYYSGPVVASGEFFVMGSSSYTCPMPVGVYVVNSLQPGQFQSNMFGGLRLNAVGPANVVINVYQGGVYQAVPEINFQGRRFPNHLWAQVIVESINGYPCPQIPYFLGGGF